MRIILLADAKKLGKANDVVEVSEGYARNYLFPRSLAKLATPEALEFLSKRQLRLEKGLQARKKLVANLASALKNKAFEFVLPSDSKGHLYAGLKEREILAKIKEGESGCPENAKLVDYSLIKAIGEHLVKLNLGSELNTTTTIIVKPKD